MHENDNSRSINGRDLSQRGSRMKCQYPFEHRESNQCGVADALAIYHRVHPQPSKHRKPISTGNSASNGQSTLSDARGRERLTLYQSVTRPPLLSRNYRALFRSCNDILSLNPWSLTPHRNLPGAWLLRALNKLSSLSDAGRVLKKIQRVAFKYVNVVSTETKLYCHSLPEHLRSW